jgi:hypothetical protein
VQAPKLLTEPPHVEDAFRFGHLHPVFQIVPIGLGRRCESAHGDAARARSSLGSHSLLNYRPNPSAERR